MTDTVIQALLVMCAVTSFVFEPYVIFGVDYTKSAEWDVPGRLWHLYSTWDPIFLPGNIPTWLWLMCAWDGVVNGPFYLWALYAYRVRSNSIRLPAIVCSSMLLYSTCIYFAYEALEEWHRIHAGLVVLINIPYTLFPILLIRRMWPGPPFASPAHEKQH